jgi:hypothetical protein
MTCFLDGFFANSPLLCVRQFYGIERLRGGGGEEDLTYLVLEDLTQAGLGKIRFLKKTEPSGFFIFIFYFFIFFILYICPEERVFRGFSVSIILLGAPRL